MSLINMRVSLEFLLSFSFCLLPSKSPSIFCFSASWRAVLIKGHCPVSGWVEPWEASAADREWKEREVGAVPPLLLMHLKVIFWQWLQASTALALWKCPLSQQSPPHWAPVKPVLPLVPPDLNVIIVS